MLTDTLIIGCGIAGAAAALRLAQNPQHRITILTRAPEPQDSNTRWAQGGIVTMGISDSPNLLVEDILNAGAGLSTSQAATILANEGPMLVQSVLEEHCGLQFDHDKSGKMIYGLEAAHSTRRVVHVGDKTGYAIAQSMLAALTRYPNITLLMQHTAVDLLTENDCCVGAVVLDGETGLIEHINAANTILATGGLGQLYLNTSNPAGARGDGVAMAYRAGAAIENAEYIQFHPTALYTDGVMKPLITEAVRGEGGILLTPDGERFMAKYAPEQMELAPRDVVARAIHLEMERGGYDYVLLDIASQRPPEFIRERFPALVENAARIGLDATRDLLPVVPVAHYFCGGVGVDDWGRTSVAGLFAIGEVSCTGLHGANRLASTSLLEGLVWGDRAARQIMQQPRTLPHETNAIQPSKSTSIDAAQLDDYRQQMQHLMWENVGIVRTESQLVVAEEKLGKLSHEVDQLFQNAQWNDELIGLRNALQTAHLVASAALHNPVSLGAHYRADTIAIPELMEQPA